MKSACIRWTVAPGIALCIAMGVPGQLGAAPPRKPSPSQFNVLVTRSPFTITPMSSGSVVNSPLERDWMLGSIRPNGEGWDVTLISRKNRKERIYLIRGFSADGFQLLDVRQDPDTFANSKVRIRRGSQTAWIGYDEKLVKIRPAAATSNEAVNQAGASKAATPPIPGQSPAPQVRRRYVPKEKR